MMFARWLGALLRGWLAWHPSGDRCVSAGANTEYRAINSEFVQTATRRISSLAQLSREVWMCLQCQGRDVVRFYLARGY